jgi:hypothetical protein
MIETLILTVGIAVGAFIGIHIMEEIIDRKRRQ